MSIYRDIIDKALAPDDFADAAAKGLPCIRLASDSALHIDGHRGIIEYGDEKLVLGAKGMEITVRGAGLKICAFNRDYIMVKGRIEGVEMTRGGAL